MLDRPHGAAQPDRRPEPVRRPAATRWSPPATRQDGRHANPPVTSVTAAAARTSAATPWVTTTRETNAASAAGEPRQPATASASDAPGGAEAARPATAAAHRATSLTVVTAPPRGSRS